MGIADYIQACALIREHSNMASFSGPRSEATILAAEKILGGCFPETYRRFLREYGDGHFGAADLFGIANDDYANASVRDAVLFTLSERNDVALPESLIVIYNVGDGELFCLNISRYDEQRESPVIAYQPGYPPTEQRPEMIAPDFGSFLLEIVQREIACEESDT